MAEQATSSTHPEPLVPNDPLQPDLSDEDDNLSSEEEDDEEEGARSERDEKGKKIRKPGKRAEKPAMLNFLPMEGLHEWEDMKSTHIQESRVHNELAAIWDTLSDEQRL